MIDRTQKVPFPQISTLPLSNPCKNTACTYMYILKPLFEDSLFILFDEL